MTPRHVLAILAAAATVLAGTVVLPQPAAAQPAGAPEIVVDPAEIDSRQRPDERVTRELTVGNAGGGALEWRVWEDPDPPQRLPRPPTTPVASAPVPEPGGRATLSHHPGFAGRPGWTVEPDAPPPAAGTLAFTHSQRQAVTAGSAVACGRARGALTAATSYLRHFPLADYDIRGDLAVTAVSFGVESLRGAAVTLTVNLYTLADPDGVFDYPNLQPIGTAEAEVTPQHMTMVEVPVTGTAPAGSILVVEVAAPDLRRGGFYLGANPHGQTADSYLRADACGLPRPAPLAALGFPEAGLLLNVTGVADVPACDVPTGAPWVSVEPLAGAVAPGGGQAVAVTFDSSGHAVGDAPAAELCLESNDPARPLAVVPLVMEVAAIPAIEVDPESLAAEQWAGLVTEQALTISNPGNAPLSWQAATAGPGGCDDPAAPPWLAVAPQAGTTPAGGTDELTVTFDPAGLPAADHSARLCLASDDPARPVVEVPVVVTVTVACDRVILGPHPGPLTVAAGLTCLAPGARIGGEVNVLDGAGLVADSAVVQGPLSTFGATTVELDLTQITGPVSVRGTTGAVRLSGLQIVGSVLVVNNQAGQHPIVVSGNWIVGSLLCTGNQPAPVHAGVPNTVVGGMKLDQCAPL